MKSLFFSPIFAFYSPIRVVNPKISRRYRSLSFDSSLRLIVSLLHNQKESLPPDWNSNKKIVTVYFESDNVHWSNRRKLQLRRLCLCRNHSKKQWNQWRKQRHVRMNGERDRPQKSMMTWVSLLYVFKSTFAEDIQHSETNEEIYGGTFASYSLICRHVKVSLLPNRQVSDESQSTYKLEHPPEKNHDSCVKRYLEKHKWLLNALLILVLLGT